MERAATWRQCRKLYLNRQCTTPPLEDVLGYNGPMTTINTIEDLARLLREQPTWAEALRALILSQDLLDLPAKFERFMEAQGGFNVKLTEFVEEQRQINLDHELSRNTGEGRLGNLEGREYERTSRTKAFARSMLFLGLQSPYVALTQDGHVDSRLTRSVALALNSGRIGRERTGDLFETDIIISTPDNNHAVFEVSVTADNDDIHRARARAEILEDITGGEVKPAVITANLNELQREQAEAEHVTIFVIPDS